MLKSIRLVPGTGVVVEIIASESNEPDADTDGDVERSKLEIARGRGSRPSCWAAPPPGSPCSSTR
jgi:hypothetical protein